MKTGPRGGIDRRQSTTPRLPRPGSRADALERKVQSGALRGASVESGALRAASGDRSRGGDDPEAADGPGVRHGWPPSAAWRPFLRATQGPEEEVGNLARACARFAPNFGPRAGQKWIIRAKTGRFNLAGPLGGISRGPAGQRLWWPPHRLAASFSQRGPTQTSRTGQARQRIRRDKGNVRKRSKTTAVFTAR